MRPFKAYLSRQLGNPSGWGGRLVLRLLNRENAGMNAIALKTLDLQPRQHILEIGFGGGALIDQLLKIGRSVPDPKHPMLQVTAIDASQVAVEMVQNKFKGAIAENTLVVRQARAEAMPFADNMFDAIVTVNTLYFWSDVAAVLQECQRCLKPRGKLVVTYSSKAFLEEQQATQFGFQAYEVSEVETYLKRAGFDPIETTFAERMKNGTFFCTHGIATNSEVM